MDGMEATRERYRAQGYGATPIGFGDRPALLVIDMQVDFVDPHAAATCAPMALERLPAVKELLAAARAARIPIFFTQGLVSPDLSDVGLLKSAPRAQGLVQVEGTPGAEIVADLAPLPSERVVTKRRPSAFFGTDLNIQLTGAKIDTLILSGTSMSGCVRATAVDSFSRDYRTMIVQECVIDRSPSLLEATLFDVAAKYADVVSLAHVNEYLRAIPARPPTATS